jgi:hypothetical protein
MMKFNGESGVKPQTEARRFVLLGLVSLLERERAKHDGFSHEITNEFDRRRLLKAIDAEITALRRRAGVKAK